MAVWTEMAEKDPTTTMGMATIEWAKRNGRIIEIIPSKFAFVDEQIFHVQPSCE